MKPGTLIRLKPPRHGPEQLVKYPEQMWSNDKYLTGKDVAVYVMTAPAPLYMIVVLFEDRLYGIPGNINMIEAI